MVEKILKMAVGFWFVMFGLEIVEKQITKSLIEKEEDKATEK